MRVPVKFLNKAFTVAVLFLATGAFLPLVMDVSNPDTLTKGTVVIQIVWAFIYVVVLVRVLPHYRQLGQLIRANKLFICLLTLVILSFLWSEDPGLTFRRSVALVGTMLVGVDLALRYSIRDQLRMLCVALGLAILLSVIVQILWPGAIPTIDGMQGEGWNGAFNQKNVFGRIIVLATISYVVRSSGRWKFLRNSVVVCCAAGLILATESRGALVVLAVLLLLLAAYGFLKSIRQRRIAYVAAGVLALVGGVVSYVVTENLDAVLKMLGRDPTLTGRVKIWQLAIESVLRKPILGYGFSGFWNVSEDAIRINHLLYWTVPHAHNGFLDLTLELGFVGLFLYLAYYVVLVRRAFDFAGNSSSVEGMWTFVYLAFAFLYSTTESSTLAANSVFGILYASVACSVSGVSACERLECRETEAETDSVPLHVTWTPVRAVVP